MLEKIFNWFGKTIITIEGLDAIKDDRNQAKEDVNSYCEQIESHLNTIDYLEKQNKELQETNDQLLEDNEKLREENESLFNSENNYVKIEISNDIRKITPIIAYRNDVTDNLIEGGYLSSAQEDDRYAIQLALMMVASEGLRQVLESFEDQFPDFQ